MPQLVCEICPLRWLGRALGHRDERAGRRDLEPLRDGMWQDALALADLLYGIAERGELGWQRRADERIEVHARLERMPPHLLM